MFFLAVASALEVTVSLTIWQYHGCKITEKWPGSNPNGLLQIKKKKQLFMSEGYLLSIYCHGAENLLYLFDNWCRTTLEEVKRRLCIALESPYNLIDVLGPFSVILRAWNFCQVKFTYFSSALETARKITKILPSFLFLSRIWIMQICAVLVVLWIFLSGNFFSRYNWTIFVKTDWFFSGWEDQCTPRMK